MATRAKAAHSNGVMGATSAVSCFSQSFPLDSLEPQPASACSPVNWSDLWNMPDESAVHTLSFALGDALEPPSLTDSTLDRMAYDICQTGRCSIAQMTQLAARFLVSKWQNVANVARQMARLVANSAPFRWCLCCRWYSWCAE